MPIAVRPRRARGCTAALAALTVAGVALTGAPAVAAPENNGDVKIHEVGTPFDDQRDEPKVCDFYLAAFNFDDSEDFTWTIDGQGNGPNAGTGHLAGSLKADTNGDAQSMPLGLPNGLYKLVWKGEDWQGAGKQKVFTVDCASPKPTPSMPGGGPGGPNGGPPAGGGGLARDAAFGPVAGAAAVGVAAVGGAMWLRLRRRPHGA